jgi:hypothetical protein
MSLSSQLLVKYLAQFLSTLLHPPPPPTTTTSVNIINLFSSSLPIRTNKLQCLILFSVLSKYYGFCKSGASLCLTLRAPVGIPFNIRLGRKWLAGTNIAWSVRKKKKKSFFNFDNCGLYYKTITIVIMTVVSDAPNCGVITYDCNWQH